MPKEDKPEKSKKKKRDTLKKVESYYNENKKLEEWEALSFGCFLRKRLPCCQ